MTDTTEQAFLARIIAAPDDDAPRLEYADWLARRGDPRGEFIRASIALHVLGHDGDPDERRRLGEIHQRYERAWTDEFCALIEAPVGTNYFPASFSRGFIDGLRISADLLAAMPEYLFSAAPLLRSLSISRPEKATFDRALAEALARRPELAQLTSIRLFSCDLVDEPVIAFVASPHLAGLRELDLAANQLGPAAVAAVLAAPFAGNLTTLQLWKNNLGDEGAAQIAALAPPGLRRLSLGENRIGPGGGLALAGSQRLAAVEEIAIGDNPLADDGVCAIVDSTALAGLRKLDVHQVGLGIEGVARLAALPGLARIEDLNIGCNDIGDAGVTALAASPHTGGLVHLDLEGSEIGDVGMQALAQARALGRLYQLGLRYNRLTDVGAAALAAATGLPDWLDLDLAYNDIEDEAILIPRFGDTNLIGQGRRSDIR